jgi:hypothetical protein
MMAVAVDLDLGFPAMYLHPSPQSVQHRCFKLQSDVMMHDY